MPPKKPATQHPGLVKQPNPAAVQPNQFKVPLKKQLTEKPADWTQERWVVDCERRRLLTGDCNDQRISGAKKKAAASVQTTFFAGMNFGLDLAEQVINTSYSNGLALMRGFFFWLQNSAHEEQFMPWIDDLKEVIPLMD